MHACISCSVKQLDVSLTRVHMPLSTVALHSAGSKRCDWQTVEAAGAAVSFHGDHACLASVAIVWLRLECPDASTAGSHRQ